MRDSQAGNQDPDPNLPPLPTDPDALCRALDDLGLAYRRYYHPPVFTVEESKALAHDMPGMHIKNLFVKNKKGAMYMITVQEDRAVDLNALAKQIGAGRLSFADADRLFTYWGVRPGSVTPFGAINDTQHQVTVVLDESLIGADLINCHPLLNDQTIGIKPADLLAFLTHTGHEPIITGIPERRLDAAAE